MNEAAGVKTRSRPALQRTELGPMMHDLAHRVYDVTEAIAMTELSQHAVPDTFEELGYFTAWMGVIIEDSIRSDVESGHQQVVRDYIDANRFNSPGGNITTTCSGSVILEGLFSGIYTTAHLYRAIDVCETRDGNRSVCYGTIPSADEQEVDPRVFADRIISPTFLRMLHELSYAPNGYLGSSSSDEIRLMGTDLLRLFREHEAPRDGTVFEIDENGIVTGFSKNFLEVKRAAIKEANGSINPSKNTGGCPVRHAEFKRLGEHALGYLDGEPLLNEGTSAITRAAQLLSNVTKARVSL